MNPRVKKSRKPPTNETRQSRLEQESITEGLDEILEHVSLRSMSLEERRKEAEKPLFLIRYE